MRAVLPLLIFLLIPFAQAVNCGDWITQSVTLSEDLYCDSKYGLIIDGDNIVLDCQGYLISNTYDSDGANLYLYHATNITIRDCVLNGTARGIYMSGYYPARDDLSYLAATTIVNNTIHHADYGIRIFDGQNNTIANNTFYNTTLSAIHASNAGDLNITGNKILSRGEPLGLGVSGRLIITDNAINGTIATQNRISDAESLLFARNTLRNCGDQLSLNYVPGAVIVNNTFLFVDDVGTGVMFSGVDGCGGAVIQNNRFITNYGGVDGINLGFVSDGIISQNNFSIMSFGILTGGSNNVIEHNNFNLTNHFSGYDIGSNSWRENYYAAYDEPNEGCNDADHNDVCDDPYPISGWNNLDYSPFLFANGWLQSPPSGSPLFRKVFLIYQLACKEPPCSD
ncbi:MAG: right-handed parallel beta-helix repeat-containing protein [Nanoarchaeota archaeon]